jgi:hypothetical protein
LGRAIAYALRELSSLQPARPHPQLKNTNHTDMETHEVASSGPTDS